ncbi:MAG: pyruvate kinase [Candidatus Muproteobacteria bacterium RIFCSPHIGHO2_12_FULL_60_33]|uniref:Pyruvate kinase n=1 Tax=Candidatus Muproteobacteria bacterium RIFCSPLOWO2_01_FULL_60_18 TaxID=1817768 RepID=A0A1F6U3M4_9PROT|nr:MAG: pyruvate kinase [Candidatus Muproteobacteria bacterium RIFCSPLOWO2_01_FULL_60_18]OGI53250.1 MAG: pyruvate kinase [Candidatus Muproteobacteria bacterium RIFCSPHIGHO2_01_60_12]OGI54259.1 MAG: pyruvate kinase [Candidatus Muproteobacteria bacterium RIFCSPHIGHO2_02_FULL_60_13]OGI55552.1 MAG: pyruvate kinase [Candidatus Muproteobacteria bacterium RIFCSPHIGHO2_12_FULL_60_33]OGI59281.1 MAG: pyruvate kinase [Candidatus Muproteobacteria bacterium RIFCSPHIGHO2_01_FULL_61_200]
MLRRTKIVATLGPATDDPKILDKLIEAGVDVARLNFSHDRYEIHAKRAEAARERSQAHGRHIGVIVDLQGPKIRIGKFKSGPVTLAEGDKFIIDASHPLDAGTTERVGTTYKSLPQDVSRGSTLLLDDGRISLWVDKVEGSEIICRVVNGGELDNNKGINRQGGGLSAAALTDKDREDIKSAVKIQADYLAISFPRSAADVEEARKLFHAAGGKGGIIAKIERAEAVQNIEEIIKASDVIMIARGDLAVEIGDAAVPPIQKRIIHMARRMNKVVITATQMMESMIENQVPTRAEVSDVANAVLDGTDAVMLSAETARGKYPVAAVAAMDRVCRVAEQQEEATHSQHRMDQTFRHVDEAIAMATMYTANHLPVRAIAALTESGSTPLWMSRISSNVPIYALTSHVGTRRKVTLYRGVYPVAFETTTSDHAEVNRAAIDELRRRGSVRDGDMVIITKGDLTGVLGGTNAMKIATVGNLPDF